MIVFLNNFSYFGLYNIKIKELHKNMEYQYHILNKFAINGLSNALTKLVSPVEKPVFLCIGSDLAIGDSLGPLCGSILKMKLNGYFIYGCLKKPVTAKEVKYINQFLKNMHPKSSIIAIDAAVGRESDIGIIKIINSGMRPGSGVNKKLDIVGDLSIMGIVAARSPLNYSILHATRLNLVYTMANIISESILKFTENSKLSSKTIQYFQYKKNNFNKLTTNPQ